MYEIVSHFNGGRVFIIANIDWSKVYVTDTKSKCMTLSRRKSHEVSVNDVGLV